MTSFIRLIKAVRGGSSDGASLVDRLVRLADADPSDEAAQVVAAYQAWVHGDEALAVRLARRAEKVDGTAHPALLVLLATSASGDDDALIYKYAKQFASATRPDRAASRVARLLAGTGLTGAGKRSEQISEIRQIDAVHDEWVAWARDFVLRFEGRGV